MARPTVKLEPHTISLPGLPDGQQVQIERSTRRRRTVTAIRRGELIVVQVPARLRRVDVDRAVAELVPKLIAKETRHRAPAGDDALAERAERLLRSHLDDHDRLPRPASVRWVTNQQQRWGSCSTTSREIRLSHRLRSMPAWVVDYVLVHELAHLRHPDHSAAFWELVRRFPDATRALGYLQGWDDRDRGSDHGGQPDQGPFEGDDLNDD